ncbi:polysaccharide biosynthesis tyrosine autokinase [Microbacterium mangrovi]|uniref:polysaccharide biosynthesis tyrosine autokinase n=1 Tax=Microbacterium mangrovi TaxID=1348253 RepID=UPI0009DD1DF8|nr:polysaccharide biosynthesis tyrosine autokinase [Microbacterium mangrovi]
MELRDYLRLFRAHWLGMIIIVVATVLLAYCWTLLQPQVYSADSSAIVKAQPAGNDIGSAVAGNSLASSQVKTFADLGSSRAVADRVIAELKLSTTPESLVSDITITNPADTLAINVSADASTPTEARDIAEAWVRGMAAEVNRLETGNAAKAGAIYLQPVDSARLPTVPSSPNVKLALAVGLLIGLALAIAYAVVRYTLDRRIRSVERVEAETGVAVIGTIPEEKSFTSEERLIPFDGGNSLTSENVHMFAVAEAMRELRTNIRFLDVDNPPRVLVVSSPLPGDGKTTTASNLAIALASAGEHVLLIDGDLRRPTVGKVFGLTGGAGLTDVLSDRADITQVVQQVRGVPNLLVLGAGKVPPNPSEVLGSERMHDLVQTIAREAIVIIDAPPLIPVTDAAVLGHNADGVIVVGTVGKTTYEMLGKALANLDRAGTRALGIVLNRVPRRGAGAAYYGYQYHGEYYRRDEPDAPAPAPTPMPAPAGDAQSPSPSANPVRSGNVAAAQSAS